MKIEKVMLSDNFWVNKVMPGIIAGLTTGAVLYFVLPPAMVAALRWQLELERQNGP